MHRADAPFPPEYSRHLVQIQQSLSSSQIPNLLKPLDVGWDDDQFWEVVEYVEAEGSIGDLLSIRSPMWPMRALNILEEVATAVACLHERSIVHADIKPSNILIERSTGEARLMDFGLMQAVGAEDVIIVGTYRYLHPHLRTNVKGTQQSESARLHLHGPMGTYSDIYALGVVTLEMLTGESNQPRPLSVDRVAELLITKNAGIRLCSREIVESLAKLIVSMLDVPSSRAGITALEIAATARTLRDVFPRQEVEAIHETEDLQPSEDTVDKQNSDAAALNATVENLRVIAESLVQSTSAMLRTTEHLEEIGSPNDLSDIQRAFENATARVRTSWRLGIVMTLFAFLLTLTMIGCAVVSGLKTGGSGWTLLFGGVSVATILGTLLWRPYDRVFRATILAGQIEMIHVQTVATFKGTTDLNRRIEVCREAISGLRTALETHDVVSIKESKKHMKHSRTKSKKDDLDVITRT
jgi:serine/threonine protein kinase